MNQWYHISRGGGGGLLVMQFAKILQIGNFLNLHQTYFAIKNLFNAK